MGILRILHLVIFFVLFDPRALLWFLLTYLDDISFLSLLKLNKAAMIFWSFCSIWLFFSPGNTKMHFRCIISILHYPSDFFCVLFSKISADICVTDTLFFSTKPNFWLTFPARCVFHYRFHIWKYVDQYTGPTYNYICHWQYSGSAVRCWRLRVIQSSLVKKTIALSCLKVTCPVYTCTVAYTFYKVSEKHGHVYLVGF